MYYTNMNDLATKFFFWFQLRRQNDKLNSCTKDLRRKLRGAQNQMHILIDERAELTAKVNSYGHIFDYLFFKIY